jgi:6-pyruvoyltetrahydropterin/6-carboxytetrahydropterin synthase
MPVSITKEIGIDMGHRVPGHASHCKNVHGHRYRIIAHVQAEETVGADSGRSDAGMVADFGVIKQALMTAVHARFDHKLVLWVNDPLCEGPLLGELNGLGIPAVQVPCIPTAEEMARYWFGLVSAELARLVDPDHPVSSLDLVAIGVWETPTSYAEFRP